MNEPRLDFCIAPSNSKRPQSRQDTNQVDDEQQVLTTLSAHSTGVDYANHYDANQSSSPTRRNESTDSMLRYVTGHMKVQKHSETPALEDSDRREAVGLCLIGEGGDLNQDPQVAAGSNSSLVVESSNVNSNRNNNNSSSNSVDSERRYRPQKYCAVCGDKAIACNFNAVTCESCKAFFRRNAFKENRLKCLFENRCTIDRVTRRFCSKCRLLKCFQIGMKREWILTDEQKQIKRVKILQNRQSRQLASQEPSPINSGGSSPQIATITRLSRPNNNIRSHQTAINNDKQAKQTRATARVASRRHHPAGQQQIAGRYVELRDAATSCPDELDLMSGGPLRGQHYCSLAFQCQYCSMRLVGCTPAVEDQPTISDTNNHLTAMQLQRIPTYPPEANQLSLAATYSAPHQPPQQQSHDRTVVGLTRGGPTNCCCLDTSNSSQNDQQQQQSQFLQHQVPPPDQQLVQSQQMHVSTHLSNESGNSFNVFSPHNPR